MSDIQLRGRLLRILYDRRNNAEGWVPISDVDFSGGEPVSPAEIASVSRQLADVGLIRWKRLSGGDAGIVAGMAQITGPGVDVVETGTSPSLRIELPSPGKLTGVESKGSAGTIVPLTSTTSLRVSARDAIDGEVPIPSSIVGARGTTVPFSEWATPAIEMTDTPSRPTSSVTINPTVYPEEPSGTVTVQNFITINILSEDYRTFSANMEALLAALPQSNTIAGEVREKLIAELEAGLKLLASPKPDPHLIELFLVRPLKYIGDKAAGPVIGAVALAGLAALGRMTGMF